MLIIFDLDDTLIDTTGSITPIKLEKALEKMVGAGLSVGDFGEASAMLKRLDTMSESASQTLHEFLEIVGGDKKYLKLAEEEVYGPLTDEIPVFPLDQAVEVLEELRQIHPLALVSMGDPEQQLLKLKKAGIDSTIFSRIVISLDRDKKPHYKKVLDELKVIPLHTVVCGDRVKRDLAPAKELGCVTVQMQWGRGLSTGPSRDVDFAIRKLSQIKDVLAAL